MIFNKQGALIKKHKFYYKNNIIENVREYKYLGFMFSCSGSDKTGINNLLKQAKKAWYALQYYLKTSKNKKISTYLHLFDTQVRPILLYACESWADSLKSGENITDNIKKSEIERFHVSVLKQLLGVHKKTSNIALLLETGRHPMVVTAQLQAIKYFLRFPTIKQGRLMHSYYETEKHNLANNDKFITFIINTLNKIGMSNIWREQLIQHRELSKETKLIANIKIRLKDISSQTIISTLTTHPGKLTILAQIKRTHEFESYLNINNFEHRRAISKIRTSSHKLEIETGRWKNTQQDKRICKNCALGTVEDELHFLFDCPMHGIERKQLFNTVKCKINVDLLLNHTRADMIQTLFTFGDLSTLNALGKFIHHALKKRDNTTCHILPSQYVYYQRKT